MCDNFQKIDGLNHVYCASKILLEKLKNNEVLESTNSSKQEKQNAYDNKLYRIMTFDRLLMSIQKSQKGNQFELSFASPKLWDDPFEKYLLDIPPKVDVNNIQSRVFACSFKNVYSQSEDAAWRTYQYKVGMPLVMLHFNAYELLKKLDEQASSKGFYIYVTDIKYSLSKEQMRQQKANMKNPVDINAYLSLLSYKRKAFEYEKELRMFIVFNDDEKMNVVQPNEDRENIFIPLTTNLIPRIIMSPLYPNNYGAHHKEIEQILNEGVKKYIEKILGKDVAQQSRLYSI